ncbi:ankyrin repeat domain-containing protein [Stenotrophomonas sp. PS02301]|uniref:ankyrin repeat domain-containing protein n=1 Tax=Stenotrophomonas sp. PS02301 TaxID=2991427 RepID=UPI00249BEADB|nr:ankyrin repeat domain-containing protein [Stenotrophomonas sp. PS02301]
MKEVSWQSNGDSLVVTVPYEIKDDFRAEFKTAKWSSSDKGWLVGDNKRNLNKLQEWARGHVNEKLDMIKDGYEPILEGAELDRAKARIAEVGKYHLSYEQAQHFYDEALSNIEQFNQTGGDLSTEVSSLKNTMEVGIAQDNGKIALKTSFDLKDAIKGTFPTAKWDGEGKSWVIDDVPGNLEKAERWKDLVDQSGIGLAQSLTKQAQELEARLAKANPVAQVLSSPDVHSVLKTDQSNAVLDRNAVRKFFETHDVNASFNVLSLIDNKEMTPLAFVASKVMSFKDEEHVLDVMSDLIELGANVNSIVVIKRYGDGDGDLDYDFECNKTTDLVDIANGGQRIKLLVKNGAPVKEKHVELMIRSSGDPELIADKYIDMIKPRHFMWLGIHEDGSTLLEKLILAGHDVNAQDHNGDTALHYVRSIEHVKYLVDAGASMTIENNGGKSFLDFCDASFVKRNASRAGVQIMKDLGIDLNSTDQDAGNTALHLLIMKGDGLEEIRNLLDAGADPEVRNNRGQLPSEMVYVHGVNRQQSQEARLLLESTALKKKLQTELGDVLDDRRSQVRRM